MNPETKICITCGSQFAIEDDDRVFLSRLDVPPPDECTRCIWKHLLAFWVFGQFRKTKSALSGKTIITTFPESVVFPLYAHDEWVSDAWDPLAYGQDYNPSRPFFDQLAVLQAKVPHPHQSGVQNTRCDWSDDVWSSKDCYLCRSLLNCEEVSYGYRTFGCKNSIDLTYCFDTERSYDCVQCFKCYGVKYSLSSRDCIDSAFLYDCRDTQNCFMCWNLRSKQYHILNKPYTKEGYFEELKKFDTRSRSSVEKLKKEFWDTIAREAAHRENFNFKTANSTGNFLNEDKNCIDCYFLDKSENCRRIFRGIDNKDTIYCMGSFAEKAVFSAVDGYVYETVTTSHTAHSRYSAYLDYCEECEYCFGCVGLRKKKYCVLNKQYTEEEYNKLKTKIVEDMKKRGEWGKFFPYNMAYCGFNFSLASWYFPETKESVAKLGGIWEEPVDVAAEGMRGDALVDRIDDATDDVPTKQLICAKTKRKFNIAPHELQFYRAQGIPLPQYHFDVRTHERARWITAVRPTEGTCYLCKKPITHYYPPEWNFQKIACVECYQQNVS